MTTRSLSPASKQSQRRAKHATSDAAFKADVRVFRSSFMYQYVSLTFSLGGQSGGAINDAYNAIVAENTGNPTHFSHRTDWENKDLNDRWVAAIITRIKANRLLPFEF